MQYYSLISKLFNFSSGYFLDTTSNKGATFWFEFRFNWVTNIQGEFLMIILLFYSNIKTKMMCEIRKIHVTFDHSPTRLNFYFGKKCKIYYHSWIRHLKYSQITKFGSKLFWQNGKYGLVYICLKYILVYIFVLRQGKGYHAP